MTDHAMNPLETVLFSLLSNGKKYSEFELIQVLTEPPYCVFGSDSLQGNLNLFQTHFILFNALYCLDNVGYETKSFQLHINVLNIRLTAYHDNVQSHVLTDIGLRDYYLDWQNFDKTNIDDVDALIDSFWKKFSHPSIATDSKINGALTYFNLTMLPSLDELKLSFRRLSLKHHPDRGGDNVLFSELLSHYNVLKVAIANKH